MPQQFKTDGMTMEQSNGFTVIELLVVFAIMGIVAAIAIPSISSTRDQLEVNQELHAIMHTLGELRAEAIRTKGSLEVNFSSTGFSWDMFDDGSTDGTYRLKNGVRWRTSTPSSFSFDGLGLSKALSTTKQLTITRGKQSRTVYINKNGYIWL